jgi:hypothetical protein
METTLSQRQIERIVERAGKFLRAVGTRLEIWRLMAGAGYTAQEHQLGWSLFLDVCGFHASGEGRAPTGPAEAAIAELDHWDNPYFQRAHAALGRLYPRQETYLFDGGLLAASGVASVAAVKTFLERVAELRRGENPRREQLREEDRAACALLEQRGIVGPEIEKHLWELIGRAKTQPMPPPDDRVAADREAKIGKAAVALQVWLDDWRTTARAVINRRDHLISLGLAERRSSSDDEPGEPGAPPDSAPTG